MARKYKKLTDEEWKDLHREFLDSGLSKRQFIAQKNLAYSSVRNHWGKLKTKKRGSFKAFSLPATSEDIRIELPSGGVIKVSPLDTTSLRTVLSVLGGKES